MIFFLRNTTIGKDALLIFFLLLVEENPTGLSGQWVDRSWNNDDLPGLLFMKRKYCLDGFSMLGHI